MTQEIEPVDDREANKTADSTFDRIYKFYYSKKRIELNEMEMQIRDRWEFAFRLLCIARTDREVVNALIKKFRIEKSTAYDDLKKVGSLFGHQEEVNKEFKRLKAEAWTIRGIHKAWKDKDLNSYHRLIARYSKINGLDVDNGNELADLIKNMKPIALIFTLTPEELKKAADDLMKDVPTIETDYQELNEGASQ